MVNQLINKTKYVAYSPVEKELFETFYAGLRQVMGGETFQSLPSSVQVEMKLELENAVYKMMDNMPIELRKIREKFKYFEDYYEARFKAIEIALQGANKMATITLAPVPKPPQI